MKKTLNNKIQLKSGHNIPVQHFVEDMMQNIRKKDWNNFKSKLKECNSIPCSNTGIIELFLRSSRATQIKAVDLFLKLGIDINCSLNGHSALSLAIELANVKMVDALIARGIDVNLRLGDRSPKARGILPLSKVLLGIFDADANNDIGEKKNLLKIAQNILKAGAKIADIKDDNILDIISETDCRELRKLLNKIETVPIKIESKPLSQKQRLISHLLGKYYLDIESTLLFQSQELKRQNISTTNKKKILTSFRSNVRQLQKIQLEITKTEFIISSSDGTERYKMTYKKDRGELILIVHWGIPTPFRVQQFGPNTYHFERDGNTISEAIWKKHE
jgi:ankyrin repeat protein